MPRYIDAELFDKKLAMEVYLADDEDFTKAFVRGMELVKNAENETPTADVQEVRHGKWIYCGHHDFHGHVFECSVCGRYLFANSKEDVCDEYPYCHCGAKMESVEGLEED